MAFIGSNLSGPVKVLRDSFDTIFSAVCILWTTKSRIYELKAKRKIN